MKGSTRMHEVYDSKYRLVVVCGPRSKCIAWVAQRQHDPRFEVRVAGR